MSSHPAQEALRQLSDPPRRDVSHAPHDVDRLRIEFLSGRDVPCPRCGYNLRNTTLDRCPECGGDIRLGVQTVPRLGPFALSIASMAAVVGFALVLAAPGWADVIRRWFDPSPNRFRHWSRADWINLDLTTAVVLVGLVALRLAVARAPRFLARKRGAQWRRAVTCVVVSAGCVWGLITAYRVVWNSVTIQW